MEAVNHSSEAERNIFVGMNHEKDEYEENEKDVKDLVSSVTYSPYVESSECPPGDEFPDSCQNSQPSNELLHTYMDNKVLECHSSDLTPYCKESTWHDIKDICVDEGVPSKCKTTWEDTADQQTICSLLLPRKDLKNEPETGNKESNVFSFDESVLLSKEDSSKCAADPHQSENLVKMVSTEKPVDVCTEMLLTESKLPTKELDGEDLRSSLKEGDKNGKPFSQISDEPTMERITEESCSGEGIIFEDLVLPSVADKSIAYERKDIPGKRRVTFHLESSAPLASSEDKLGDHQQVGRHKMETSQEVREQDIGNARKDTSELTDHTHEYRIDSNPTELGLGESSFSSVGPMPFLVNCSGPISHSGNVSLRSDSSTTSARSFAFPIIQSEWNSSPVRMANADRRPLRKHKGWRESCLCCRF